MSECSSCGCCHCCCEKEAKLTPGGVIAAIFAILVLLSILPTLLKILVEALIQALIQLLTFVAEVALGVGAVALLIFLGIKGLQAWRSKQ